MEAGALADKVSSVMYQNPNPQFSNTYRDTETESRLS